jgi:hypothetical protein
MVNGRTQFQLPHNRIEKWADQTVCLGQIYREQKFSTELLRTAAVKMEQVLLITFSELTCKGIFEYDIQLLANHILAFGFLRSIHTQTAALQLCEGNKV